MACCCEKKNKLSQSSCCKGGNTNPESEKSSYPGTRLIISLVSLIISFLIANNGIHFPGFPLSDPAWIAVLLCGFPLVKSAFEALFFRKKITSALLISVAIFASLALQFFMVFCGAVEMHHDSYIFAAGEIAFLMELGELIENKTLKKARDGIEALVKISPKQALKKLHNGDEEIVPVEMLTPGDIIIVRPNDMIPADGEIVEGISAVNQASMTGESIPVDKTQGDSVLAGTWNLSGALEIRVTKRSEDTAIARLVRIVAESESKKAPIVNIADRWAGRIVPAAIICSLLVFSFAFWILEKDFSTSLIRGVTILVVFCPCAFALATPTAIAAGIGNAARRGILIKSGIALEKLSSIRIAAFDKTGTLTQAKLKVEAIFANTGFDEKNIINICAAAEKRSQHPIAKAIISAAGNANLPIAKNISVQNGIGISCDIDEMEVQIRSINSVLAAKIELSQAEDDFSKKHAANGETLVYLLLDNKIAGIIALSDTLREDAYAAIKALHSDKIHTVMLTGDNHEAAKNIAKTVGVEEFFAEQLPADKAKNIKALQSREAEKSTAVLMVGDGVNDAPALASADCSIAMGALGSELAVDTADIAILNENLRLIPSLLKFSRAVLKTIHINFALSLSINFAAVILSAAGILDPVTGAVVHNASSVLVVLNSASLLARKKDFEATAHTARANNF